MATDGRGAIVLCGGASRRMGCDKASLPFGNASLLARTVGLVEQCVEQVVVVARSAEQKLPGDANDLDVTTTCDRRPGNGPLEAVAAGWAALPVAVSAAVVCGCDTPLLRPALVARLFQRLAGFDAVVPIVGGRVHPLLAVYARQSCAVVQRCLRQGKRSMRDLLKQLNVCWIEERQLRDVDRDLESFMNINDEASYRHALQKAGFSDDRSKPPS